MTVAEPRLVRRPTEANENEKTTRALHELKANVDLQEKKKMGDLNAEKNKASKRSVHCSTNVTTRLRKSSGPLTTSNTAPISSLYIAMFEAINSGLLAAQELCSPENSTPTSFERFVEDVFASAYHGKALTA